MGSHRTRDDEIYEQGVRDGQQATLLDQVSHSLAKGFTLNPREQEIYNKGYEYGVTHPPRPAPDRSNSTDTTGEHHATTTEATSSSTGCAQALAILVGGLTVIAIVFWVVINIIVPVALLNSAVMFAICALVFRTRSTVFASLALLGGCYLLVDTANGWLSATFAKNVVGSSRWLTSFVYLNTGAVAVSTWLLVRRFRPTAPPTGAKPDKRNAFVFSSAAATLIITMTVLPPVIYYKTRHPFTTRTPLSDDTSGNPAGKYKDASERALQAGITDDTSDRLVRADVSPTTTGVLRDSRDGNVYKTVKIGDQWWMAENLNHKVASGGTWCYGDKPANCRVDGRLYDWATAWKACPEGWHLPTDDEWKTLEANIGLPSAEIEQDGWRGTKEASHLKMNGVTGFSAKMAGYRTDEGRYVNYSVDADFWTASEVTEYEAWTRKLTNTQQPDVDGSNSHNKIGRVRSEKVTGYYVRCVQHLGAAPVFVPTAPRFPAESYDSHDPNESYDSACLQCGAYLERERGSECIEIFDTAIFHYWDSRGGPANYGVWQQVDDKIRWYRPPDSLFKGREAEIQYNLRDAKRWRAFLGRMISSWQTTSEADFEDYAYDPVTQQMMFGDRTFVKTGQRRCPN